MVEIVRSKKLAYFPSRKVANTSIRLALKELAEGPDDYWSSPDVPISPLTRYYARGCRKIAVVRDPVKRFLSAYGNRVDFHNDITRQSNDRFVVKVLKLQEKPDISTFCKDFYWYYGLNDKIRRHFRLQHKYLGKDLGYFDKIYTIEDLDQLALDISGMAGKPVTLQRLQTGGPKIDFADLSGDVQRMVLKFTGPDYELLREFYAPPKLTL